MAGDVDVFSFQNFNEKLSSQSDSMSRNKKSIYGTQQHVPADRALNSMCDPCFFNSPQGLSRISQKCTPTPQSSASQNGGGIAGNAHGNQSYIKEIKRILGGFEQAKEELASCEQLEEDGGQEQNVLQRFAEENGNDLLGSQRQLRESVLAPQQDRLAENAEYG